MPFNNFEIAQLLSVKAGGGGGKEMIARERREAFTIDIHKY